MRSWNHLKICHISHLKWVSLGKCWKTFFQKHPENAGTWSAWKSVHVIWCNDIYDLLRTADLLPSVVRFNVLRTSQWLAPQEWWLSFVAHRGQVLLRSGPWDITTSVAQSFESMVGIYPYVDSHIYYVMALVFCSGVMFDLISGMSGKQFYSMLLFISSSWIFLRHLFYPLMQIRSNLVHQYNTSQEDQRKWGLPMWKLLWKIITGWCKSFVQPLVCFNSVVLAITGKRVFECPTSWENVFLHWLLKRGDAVYIQYTIYTTCMAILLHCHLWLLKFVVPCLIVPLLFAEMNVLLRTGIKVINWISPQPSSSGK